MKATVILIVRDDLETIHKTPEKRLRELGNMRIIETIKTTTLKNSWNIFGQKIEVHFGFEK